MVEVLALPAGYLQPMRWNVPNIVSPQHEIVIGSIGMGKSFWVLYKIIQSFIFDRPCMYIDPKGDTYLNVLNFLFCTKLGQKIWEEKKPKILLLNTVNTSGSAVGFNASETMHDFFMANPDKIALLATSLVSHIKREAGWDVGTAYRMEAILNASLGLMAANGEHILTEIPLLFMPTYWQDEKGSYHLEKFNPYTAELRANCHHPVNYFWDYQWSTWSQGDRAEWVNPVNNQLFRYLFDTNIRRVLCARQTATLDFRKVIDEGMWVFVNAPYHYIGDTLATLLGNILITKLFYAAFQRNPTSDYRLILDEARFFNTGPLDKILNTSRYYRLWLTMVVQSIDQMCRTRTSGIDEYLKETALNVVNYFSIFQNTIGAKELSDIIFPITGQVARAYYDDRIDYQSPTVEQDMNRRRLMALQKRQMVQWDKVNQKPRVIYTPDVELEGNPDWARIAFMENTHIRQTGRPNEEIDREIETKEQEILAKIHPPKEEREKYQRGWK